MTLLVAHRRNTAAELASTPPELGIEMDIRSRGDRLVVTHEPFDDGEDLERWLDGYRHAFLVANVKEEGLEERVEAALAARGVEEWAYLDQSFPFMVRTLRRGEDRCMVRLSEYESVQTVLSLAPPLVPRPRWVWLDSFTGALPPTADLALLAAAGHRVMLVSPELQGRDPEPEVAACVPGWSRPGCRWQPCAPRGPSCGPEGARAPAAPGRRRWARAPPAAAGPAGAGRAAGLVRPVRAELPVRPVADPWSAWLASGGTHEAFPYGPLMLLWFSVFGGLTSWLPFDWSLQFGMALGVLVAEAVVVGLLLRAGGGRPGRSVVLLAASPVVVYAAFVHGQLDLVPTALMLASVLAFRQRSWSTAGLLAGLAIAVKASSVLIVPLPWCSSCATPATAGHAALPDRPGAGLVVYLLPALSSGYRTMVIGTPEFRSVFDYVVTSARACGWSCSRWSTSRCSVCCGGSDAPTPTSC